TNGDLCKEPFTATLTATGCNADLVWSTGATMSSITVSTAGTYYAECKSVCETKKSNEVTVTKGTPPVPPVVAVTGSSTLCPGQSATLTATGCTGTVTWSTGATGSSITVSTAGTYFATCTTDCGVSGKSNEVTITTVPAPTKPEITASNKICCPGQTVTLTATGCNGTLLWSTGATSSTITVSEGGDYTVSCSNSCGTTATSEKVTITKIPPVTTPTVTVTNGDLCKEPFTATLTATGCNAELVWSTGATTSSITVSTAGTYYAECKSVCETKKSNEVTVTKGTPPVPPVVAVTGSSTLCPGQSATLTATGCTGTVTWSTGATGSSITVSTAGTYFATCTTDC